MASCKHGYEALLIVGQYFLERGDVQNLNKLLAGFYAANISVVDYRHMSVEDIRRGEAVRAALRALKAVADILQDELAEEAMETMSWSSAFSGSLSGDSSGRRSSVSYLPESAESELATAMEGQLVGYT